MLGLFDLPDRLSTLLVISRPACKFVMLDVPLPLYNILSGGGRGKISTANSSSSSSDSSSLNCSSDIVKSAVVDVSSSSSSAKIVQGKFISLVILPTFIPHTRG
jgi:hypothetical protein